MGMTTSTNLFGKPATPPKIGAGAEVPAPSSFKRQRDPAKFSRASGEPLDDGEADAPRRRFEPIPGESLPVADPPYDETEQAQIARIFADMLKMATGDGGNKRRAGLKVPWWKDPEHLWKIFSHFRRYFQGKLADPDSGAHPLVHVAWRCLAIAYQDTQGKVCPLAIVEGQGKVYHQAGETAVGERESNGYAHMDELGK